MTRVHAITAALALTLLLAPRPARADDIGYRSFSASAAIGPPAEEFSAKLAAITTAALGAGEQVHFVKLAGLPPIPPAFGNDIVTAVAAGAAKGGFDAAYISGSDLNKTWGFLYNSGVPFGPTFDEFMGFLYGKSIGDGTKTGLDLVAELLDARGRGVIAIPIVGSPEQLSGYFSEPMEDVHGHKGIGLAGLCGKPWILRYLPPGENVLGLACDELVALGKVAKKRITFIAAVPGGGSLVDAVAAGTLQGFEFATPVDDVSQLFNTAQNPGTVGVRFVHTPGWQQQFLVTWMIVNKAVWDTLGPAQQAMTLSVARDHVVSSYGENLRKQGQALGAILDANKKDGNAGNDMVLSRWPMSDLRRLREATIRFLNARIDDPALPAADRADYGKVLEALRTYVRANDLYWDKRQVDTQQRFEDWASRAGDCWGGRCDQTCSPLRRP